MILKGTATMHLKYACEGIFHLRGRHKSSSKGKWNDEAQVLRYSMPYFSRNWPSKTVVFGQRMISLGIEMSETQ